MWCVLILKSRFDKSNFGHFVIALINESMALVFQNVYSKTISKFICVYIIWTNDLLGNWWSEIKSCVECKTNEQCFKLKDVKFVPIYTIIWNVKSFYWICRKWFVVIFEKQIPPMLQFNDVYQINTVDQLQLNLSVT